MHTVPKFTVYMKNYRIIVIKVFPGISRGGIGQGGKYREIPPGKYRPGISRTTLVLCKKTSATKSCLVVIGISFIILIYIHTMSMSINTSPQNSRNKFLIIHETWHKTWPLKIHRSVLICISEVDDVISW